MLIIQRYFSTLLLAISAAVALPTAADAAQAGTHKKKAGASASSARVSKLKVVRNTSVRTIASRKLVTRRTATLVRLEPARPSFGLDRS